jgi:hypothetical protein
MSSRHAQALAVHLRVRTYVRTCARARNGAYCPHAGPLNRPQPTADFDGGGPIRPTMRVLSTSRTYVRAREVYDASPRASRAPVRLRLDVVAGGHSCGYTGPVLGLIQPVRNSGRELHLEPRRLSDRPQLAVAERAAPPF